MRRSLNLNSGTQIASNASSQILRADPPHWVYNRHLLIHKLFEERVRLTPSAKALVYDDKSLTYAELNAYSNRLALRLLSEGVRIGECVAVLLERSPEMIASQIAILKCGGVYVPLDPALPPDRRVCILRDCGARYIVASSPEMGSEMGLVGIDCPKDLYDSGEFGRKNPCITTATPWPAYVMYTSGSTGIPKGVLVSHHSVIRLVGNSNLAQIGVSDCVAHCSNTAFDAATFEVWGALLSGARLLIVPQATLMEAELFKVLIARERVTVMFLTTRLFNRYSETIPSAFSQVRWLLVGGEALDPDAIRTVLLEDPPENLLNVYGPTECTTFSSSYKIDTVSEDTSSIPIGRALTQDQLYILDKNLNPVPPGVTGDLYVGGEGISLGYLDRPELTAERFIADPFTLDKCGRIYKTGDLAYWRADEVVEFVGRRDRQIKLRGYRIELDDVEAHLKQHPKVNDAVVIVRQEAAGDPHLVAYFTPLSDVPVEFTPRPEEIRAHLRKTLPDYMIPSAFVVLRAFPLTLTEKLDRKALPAPGPSAYSVQPYVPPKGALEETLVQIWKQLFNLDQIGREDNFFEIGGTSVMAMALVAELAVRLITCTAQMIYQAPTVRLLAGLIEDSADRTIKQNRPAETELHEGVL